MLTFFNIDYTVILFSSINSRSFENFVDDLTQRSFLFCSNNRVATVLTKVFYNFKLTIYYEIKMNERSLENQLCRLDRF